MGRDRVFLAVLTIQVKQDAQMSWFWHGLIETSALQCIPAFSISRFLAPCPQLALAAASSSGNFDNVRELTSSNLDETLSEGTWLLEFYAPWCGYCKRLEPIYEEVAAELLSGDSGVKVARVDGSAYKGGGRHSSPCRDQIGTCRSFARAHAHARYRQSLVSKM